MVKGICKLCLVEKELVKESHIFSEFLYTNFYDEKHKMLSFAPQSLDEENSRINRIPKGEYEGGLLCSNCETIISKYESYVRKFFLGGNFAKNKKPVYKHFKNIKGQEFTQISNVDYTNFKLFILSLIWRASISSRPLFKEISLPNYNDKLREMLYECNPGEEDDFPLMCWHFIKDESIPSDALMIGQPSLQVTDNITLCKLLIRKFWIFCAIDLKVNHQFFSEFTIKKTNEWVLFSVPKGHGAQFIKNHFRI